MWYDVGTISVTNGSTTVTGTGTDFISGVQVGEAFLAPDDKLYEIASITSATVLVLADAYLGSTQSGQGYKIVPTQSLVADLASDVTDLISDYADVKDKAGAGKFNDGSVTNPAITFEQDQNNGLYRIGSDNWGMVAGGTKQIDISTTDVELNYSGSKKLATTSTGVDVTGTVTADGLTVNVTASGTNASTGSLKNDGGGANTKADLDFYAASTKYATVSGGYGASSAELDIKVGNTPTKVATFSGGGDVSFYEDTGTTAKMVWDASAETLKLGTHLWLSHNGSASDVQSYNSTPLRLNKLGNDVTMCEDGGSVGIGIPDPTSALAISRSAAAWAASTSEGLALDYNSGNAKISTFSDSSTLQLGAGVTQKNGLTIYGQTGGNRIQFDVAGSERMRIDSAGNVGIGTASPDDELHIKANSHPRLRIDAGLSGEKSNLLFINSADGTYAQIENEGSALKFLTQATERARIDSSGNLLVGTTTVGIASTTSQGINILGQYGAIETSRNNASLFLNRLSTDGDIAVFRKDGLPVGSIGVTNSLGVRSSYYASELGTGITFGSVSMLPTDGSGNLSSGTKDLGYSNGKWKDLYLSGVAYANYVGSASDTNTNIAFDNADVIRFTTGSAERARIDSSGNLLIGTTISAGLANSTFVRKGSDGQLLLGANDGGLYHQAQGAYYLVTTAGGSTSDINLKKDITELATPLEKVCKIRGVNFQYKDKQKSTSDNGVQLGVIAQEVEAVFPEIVLTNSDGVKTVRYDRLVAPLIEAVKEQNKLINDLKTRIETLENN